MSGALMLRSMANLSTNRLRNPNPPTGGNAVYRAPVSYCATQPPSMTSSLPVTKDASSDARYSTP